MDIAVYNMFFNVSVNVVHLLFTELGEARSELAPIENQVEEAKNDKNSMASKNSKEMKKLEAEIRAIRDQQKDFEQIYNQVKEYKMSSSYLLSFLFPLKRFFFNLVKCWVCE